MTDENQAKVGSSKDPDLYPNPKSRLLTYALWLLMGTLVYNVVEAGLALWAGYQAGSIALVSFGFDSGIEIVAASVILWRMRVEARGAPPEVIEAAENRVYRIVGISFFLLATFVIIQSVWTLVSSSMPEESRLGLALAVASLIVMPLIAFGKHRLATKLGSPALLAEAKETLACSYLSFCLLLGLAANELWGWWWADPGAALLMVPWLVHEGLETLDEDEENNEGGDDEEDEDA